MSELCDTIEANLELILKRNLGVARRGYVKPWKINSISITLTQLVMAGAELTLDRIDKLIRGSCEMEGIDSNTIDNMVLEVAQFLNVKE